jgi:hypothetical protein
MLREVLFVRDESRPLLANSLFIFCYALLFTTFGGPQNSQNQSQQFESQQFESQQFASQQFESQQFESQQFESQQFIAYFSSKRKQLLT